MTAKPYALSGFRDKLYWRHAGGRYHCFKKTADGVFRSLCERFARDRSGGGATERPEPLFRCGLCDGREANRRGWDGSGPVTRAAAKAMGGS